jgi:hypothetical protein
MTGKLAAFVALVAAYACSDPQTPDGGGSDTGIHDAEEREAGPTDALPDADVDPDAGDRDFGPRDVPSFDGGEGAYCEQAIAWPEIELPLVATTSASVHASRFECAGLGGGAIAPERWIETRFDEPMHAIVRLGTAGWDAVMTVRTATCAPSGEVACADAPTIVELPAISGRVFIGVDGFTDGRGPFVLSGELGPALVVPPQDSICELAATASLPVSRIGHNFGADGAAELEGCPLTAPIFVPLDLSSAGDLSVRVEPRAGQDLSLAVLSECGAVIACSAGGGAGHAEMLRQLSLPSGRAAIAIGSPPGAIAGSFTIMAALGAECTADADCPLGERCTRDLACGPPASASAISLGAEIPDNDRIELPLVLTTPIDRPPSRVRVRLAIEHEFPRDVVVTLASPGGWPIVRLRDRLDGALDSVYGKDRPADGPGSMFDFGLAATASGTWTLGVEDRAPGDVGRVTGVVLEVE